MIAQHEPAASSSAMAVAHCREVLGEEAEGLSDGEVDTMRRHADAMASLIVAMFLTAKKNG